MTATEITVIMAVMGAVTATRDGRKNRKPIQRYFSKRSTVWKDIFEDDRYDTGWFVRELRCKKQTFLWIVQKVEDRWRQIHKYPHHNSVFKVVDRVAVTMHYITHADGYDQAGSIFGMGKSSVFRYVKEVIEVLITYSKEVISLPSSREEWVSISEGFEKVQGFPNVCGAIDGTLIRVKKDLMTLMVGIVERAFRHLMSKQW